MKHSNLGIAGLILGIFVLLLKLILSSDHK